MATKPALINEAIALTEKKMDMALDDIIKMSTKSSSKAKRSRPSNKRQGFLNGHASQGNSAKVQRFINSRSSLRQGVLAQRRSNFRGFQFPLAKEMARKAAAANPVRNRVFNRNKAANWNKPRVTVPLQRPVAESGFVAGRSKVVQKQKPQTLDSLFANMKEQRMRSLPQKQMQGGQNARHGSHLQQQSYRGRTGGGGYFGNY